MTETTQESENSEAEGDQESEPDVFVYRLKNGIERVTTAGLHLERGETVELTEEEAEEFTDPGGDPVLQKVGQAEDDVDEDDQEEEE